MKQCHSIVFTFLVFFCNHAFAQDYTPTKETVPDISSYKALIVLENALNASVNNIYSSKTFEWGSSSKYFTSAWQIKDSFAFINSTFDFGKGEIYNCIDKIFFAETNPTPLTKTKKLGNSFSIQRTNYSPSNPHKNHQVTKTVFWLLDINYNRGKEILDALFILKNKDQKSADQKEIEDFKSIAQQYRMLVVKPDLNEDARRFLVQATTATEEKRYTDGIDLLEKAIAIDPAYPQAHFNRALLWAQVSIYGAAILEMKKYLMLVPDAADARASQDKIYEWEGKLNK